MLVAPRPMRIFTRSVWLVLLGLAVGCKSPQTIFRLNSPSAFATSKDGTSVLVSEVSTDQKGEPVARPLPAVKKALRNYQNGFRVSRVERVRPHYLDVPTSRKGSIERVALVNPNRKKPRTAIKDGQENIQRAILIMFAGLGSLLASIIGLIIGSWIVGGLGLLGVAVCLYLLYSGVYEE